MKFCIINGPNLNMLGTREVEIYGSMNLKDIEKFTRDTISKLGHKVDQEWFQSNSEEEIINKIHELASSDVDCLVINPAAFSHTSVAILDALSILKCPVIEVHLSNTNRREEFRQKKITAKSSTGVIEGIGYKVYSLAILSQLIK
ncbi:type II 3-dehydroquinate dehydratase [Bacteriovorax sp. DB6_IX]|uniref:type II 3-dehydroquinate dehydratase n=1 Tax=Bacteriovorax sp. DB6_IX TaxID=1353530 RepID=UPI000554C746|nr:type II 3-dehydroquinate dehydratase [Bacteriovorax sp. DB6_IX]